jgi:hypothetical protein
MRPIWYSLIPFIVILLPWVAYCFMPVLPKKEDFPIYVIVAFLIAKGINTL